MEDKLVCGTNQRARERGLSSAGGRRSKGLVFGLVVMVKENQKLEGGPTASFLVEMGSGRRPFVREKKGF